MGIAKADLLEMPTRGPFQTVALTFMLSLKSSSFRNVMATLSCG